MKQSVTIQDKVLNTIVLGYIGLQLLVWGFVPYLARAHAPHDAVTSSLWARNLAFGYSKNPYLTGWIARLEFIFNHGHPSGFGYFFVHMAFVGVGIWGLYCLGQLMFRNRVLAFLIALSLNFSLSGNVNLMTLNDNYLLIAFIPWMFYCFIRAVEGSQKHWLWLGFISGVAIMSKYNAGLFLPFMFLYTLLHRPTRQHYRRGYIYGGVFIMGLICLPNVIWLMQHDFVAFQWVFDVMQSNSMAHNLGVYFCVWCPILVLALVCALCFKGFSRNQLTQASWAFLLTFALPVVMVMVYLLFHGSLRLTEWLDPYAGVYAVLLFCFFVPRIISNKRLIAFISVAAFLFCLVAVGYAIPELHKKLNHTAHNMMWPKVARQITQLWYTRYHQKLCWVAGQGSSWLTFYSPDYPNIARPLGDCPIGAYGPSVSDQQLLREGIAVVGNVNSTSPQIQELFQQYQHQVDNTDDTIKLSSHNTRVIALHFLPPQH